jgi:hypothetical protein
VFEFHGLFLLFKRETVKQEFSILRECPKPCTIFSNFSRAPFPAYSPHIRPARHNLTNARSHEAKFPESIATMSNNLWPIVFFFLGRKQGRAPWLTQSIQEKHPKDSIVLKSCGSIGQFLQWWRT